MRNLYKLKKIITWVERKRGKQSYNSGGNNALSVRPYSLLKEFNKLLGPHTPSTQQSNSETITRKSINNSVKTIKIKDNTHRVHNYSQANKEESRMHIKGLIFIVPVSTRRYKKANKIINERIINSRQRLTLRPRAAERSDASTYLSRFDKKAVNSKLAFKIRLSKQYRYIRKANIIRRASGISAILELIKSLIQTIEGRKINLTYGFERIYSFYNNAEMTMQWRQTSFDVAKNKQTAALEDTLSKSIPERPILAVWQEQKDYKNIISTKIKAKTTNCEQKSKTP